MKGTCVLSLVAILLFTVSCTQQSLQQSKTGLDAAIEQMPRPKDFELVATRSWTTSMTAGGQTCYYAEAYAVFGTSLPEKEALVTYVEELKALGWASEDTIQYAREQSLVRGTHEWAGVSYGGYGTWSVQDSAYAQALNTYPTVVLVRLRYILPARDGC